MRNWIFQAVPTLYDLKNAVSNLSRITYLVRQFNTLIKPGDRVYLWEAGSNAGIVAVATVETEPEMMTEDESERPYLQAATEFDFQEVETRVWLKIDRVLQSPLAKSALQQDPVLSSLSILKQPRGTNFEVTPTQAQTLEKLLTNVRSEELKRPNSLTGAEAGLSGNDQINIALQTIVANNGVATMQQIYDAVEAELDEAKLSEQGKASLRYFINKTAVNSGYVAPYDEDKPGWWITQTGRNYLAGTDTRVSEEKEKKMPLPLQLTQGQVLAAMKTFDEQTRPERPQTGLNSWQNLYNYFVKYEGKLYPAKRLAEMAAETEMPNTDTARRYLQTAGFEIVKIPNGGSLAEIEEVWPDLDGPAFVVIHKYEMAGQELGQSYIFGRRASGDSEKLGAAVRAQGAGGAPVYLVIYRPGPEYSLAAWARVNRVSGDYDAGYRLDLDYHPFPEPLDLKGNAAHLLRQIDWLKGGLKPAFNYRSIREISSTEFNSIIEAARDKTKLSLTDAVYDLLAASPNGSLTQDELIQRLREQGQYPAELSRVDFANRLREDNRFMHAGGNWTIRLPLPVFLPVAWPGLREYWNFVQLLDEPSYTAETLRARASEYGEGFNSEVDGLELATNLCQLRLLSLHEPTDRGEATFTIQEYANGEQSNINEAALLRLMALGLLLPIEESVDKYELLARRTVPRLRALIEGNEPFQSGLAPELRNDEDKLTAWYAESGLLTYQDGEYRAISTALDSLNGTDRTTATYNDFLNALLAGLQGKSDLEPISGNPTLRPLTAEQLTTRLNELKQDLIIDEMVVRRIYRSLIAGRHVVLSGPPGTGKTELARRLPELLWREEREVRQVTTDLNNPPSKADKLIRKGYKPLLVTATEDWGVSDVIGGIRPRLNGESQSLSYAIHYGHLTRAILKNYDGLDRLDNLPEELPTPQRGEYRNKNERYSGVWLVIDEFNRAPIDAAFGSLLTTLSGSTEAHLAVPTGVGGELSVPVPKDFRIIGTLNSFDRHFLNQMSEALKRRFDFIDVLPPTPAQADEEQRLARRNALNKLSDSGVISGSLDRYEMGDLQSVFTSFWRIFMAIRLFRQFGTAQAEATYLNLFSGVMAANLEWPPALDYALADTLADQLQVLNRDEQRILLAYLRLGHDTPAFVAEFREKIVGKMPQNRHQGLLSRLAEAYALRFPNEAAFSTDEKKLSAEQIGRLFDTGQPFDLPHVTESIFYQRLNSLTNEQGL